MIFRQALTWFQTLSPDVLTRALVVVVTVVVGLFLVLVGLWISFGWRLPFRLGRLPGDIHIHRGNSTFYFPVVTCLVLSVILTLLLSLFRR